MNYRSAVLLLCPAAIAALLYAVHLQSKSTAILGDIRDSVKETVAETRAVHRTLRRQRGAINGIHSYLVPVTKGAQKQAS
jgi:hypothetical protein